MDLLRIDKIYKTYNQHQALSDVSMEVPAGSIFGLLGPNGAGKTTLIRIITRIIDPDSGKVFLNGEEMTPDLVRSIGYLPEERGLYKKMKVGEHLLYLARLKGMNRPDAVKNIRAWLDRLDLLAWSNRNIEDLSKGMAQKVQFIATVVHDPKLIILDEPFSGFDPVNANLIKDEILRLREEGMTVIFSTHRMESVEELCEHIALINKSEKILDGEKLDIKNEHKDDTFQVIHEGELEVSPGYEIIHSNVLNTGNHESIVRMNGQTKPNELLRLLMDQVQIHSFVERVPTINEIFIKLVKGGSHE